jgi:hypothetical protein
MGLLFGLLASEVWIRIYKPQPLFLKIAAPNFDKDTGMPKRTPMQTGFTTKEYAVDRQTNTLGFHDAEHKIARQENTYRIVVLGDSFSEAAQVPIKDTWCKQLELLLQKLSDKNIEVVNLGIGGAGTGWEFLIFEKLGVQYKPDLVILAFHLGSDFFNNHPHMEDKFEKPFFTIRDGKAFLIGDSELEVRVRGVWMPLWRISHLYRYLHRTLYKLDKGVGIIRNGIPIFFEQYLVNSPPQWNEAENYTLVYLRQIQDLAQKNDCIFIVVNIPDKFQIYEDYWTGLKNKWPVMKGKKWDLDAPAKRLNRIIGELRTPYIDLLSIFRARKLSTADRLYFKEDIHFNSTGNRMAAEAISENIIKYIK